MRALATFVLLFVGCAASGGPGSQSPSGGGCFPVAPLQLTVLEHGSEWEPVAMLAADGTITASVGKSATSFRIVGDTLQDGSGAPKMTCDSSRVLHVGSAAATMHFDASDALVGDGRDRSRIFVADSGDVEVALGGPSRPMPWRVVGVTASTRRTAELLVLATMASANWGG